MPSFASVEQVTGARVAPVLAPSSDIAKTIDEAFGRDTSLTEFVGELGLDHDLEVVEKDLGSFETMLNESDDLERLVRSPVFTAADQARAIGAILAKSDMSTLTSNFISLVAKNRRLFAIRDMVKAYRSLLAAHRGEVAADVTSARALSDDQIAALKASLKEARGLFRYPD